MIRARCLRLHEMRFVMSLCNSHGAAAKIHGIEDISLSLHQFSSHSDSEGRSTGPLESDKPPSDTRKATGHVSMPCSWKTLHVVCTIAMSL